MKNSSLAAGIVLLMAGCASSGTPPLAIPSPMDVPAALQPPAGQEPFLQVHAVGVQVYECAVKADAAGVWAWQFRRPEAMLEDAGGKVVGWHFAGPAWVANDRSTIVGNVSASVAAPEAGDIPWLLLVVKSREGQGLLTEAASVQRLDTEGGAAPHAACGPIQAGQVERVGYTATYVFWRPRTS